MIGEPVTAMSHDIADGGLIDVRSLSLSDLRAEADESSLARALERILASGEDNVRQYGFSNSI